MNRDEIMNMQPGRELDALVAVKVMGGELKKDGVGEYVWRVEYGYLYPDSFKPSTDISAAWEVAEKFETIEIKRFVTDKGLWFCEIKTNIWYRSYGKSAPEAICKAALLSLIQEDTP